MAFGEKSSPTAAIAAILAAYPFSVGLLREFLQNSDDAKASTQTFVLDSRTHPNNSLYHPELAGTQGPALLACNDALFLDSDWEAVQRPHESSKVADTNKIGKYGVGFRSCYHVTDNPQILSGSSVAIFDPHHMFTETGGALFDFAKDSSKYADQLAGFDFFLEGNHAEPFPKTVVRLPLRTRAGALSSRIKNEVVEPSKIHKIFESFIEEELAIALLFLTSVTSIKIYEVDDSGSRCLAEAELVKGQPELRETGAEITTSYISGVNVSKENDADSKSWRIFGASYPRDEAAELLSERLGYDVAPALEKQKLRPNVAFAVPLDLESLKQNKGRLYTFLPLPLSTGFPCHVQALFALTPDRQHLRNSEETGLVEGVDSVIVEWNRLLFDTFIPNAWASMIPVLLYQDHFVDIFRTWPPSQPAGQGGDTSYWKKLPSEILRAIVRKKLAVWPVISHGLEHSFSELDSLLVADAADKEETLAALAAAGVEMTQPPPYIKALLENAGIHFTPLTPDTARVALLDNIAALSRMHSDTSAIKRIASYLLSAGNIALVIGLPLVQVANGQFISLEPLRPNQENHVLLDGDSLKVFRDSDSVAIDLTQLSPREAELFLTTGPTIVNIVRLDVERVLLYLKCAFANFGLDIHTPAAEAASDAVVQWLIWFWEWVGAWDLRTQLYRSIGSFALLPTERNILVPVAQGTMVNAPDSVSVRMALTSLGLSFIHPSMSQPARLPLVEQGLIKSAANGIHILERMSLSHADKMPNELADCLRGHILDSLVDFVRSTPLSAQQAQKLRALPMFPTLVMQEDGSTVITEIRAIDHVAKVISVTQTKLLPAVPHIAYIKGCDVLKEALPDIFEQRNAAEMVSFAIENIVTQPKRLQCMIVAYIVDHRDNITDGQKRKLAQASFVAVGSQPSFDLRPATELFNPDCAVAGLYTKQDFYVPSTSSKEDKAIVQGLKALGLFRSKLTKEVIEERITYLSKCHTEKESYRLALNLLQIIVSDNFDAKDVPNLRSCQWLPCEDSNGLRTSAESHHPDAHPAALFDEVLFTLKMKYTNTSLRHALGWQAPLHLDIILTQLDRVIKQASPSIQRLTTLVHEFGRRVDNLDKSDLERLRGITHDRPWVPISRGCVAVTGRAVLSPRTNSMPPGFYKIPSSLSDDASTEPGCAA
ncbi:hypothetical protein FIBSPDRAFT_1042283 [Athelia psychrophila]|uniref:Sacsin/Nov domain-containing protein n=1 Tax=Athelia psychrophila TaxID=1759441 RepID=A0A166MQT9_9AGAM|nr:hypothetical protein FIBSPDRAFT_1042283 [Fibularhizoctonia sp. CBS 109695]